VVVAVEVVTVAPPAHDTEPPGATCANDGWPPAELPANHDQEIAAGSIG